MKKGILFDLDGTLWDSVPELLNVYNSVLLDHPESGPVMTLDTLRSYMGKSPEALADAIFTGEPEAERRMALLDECFRREDAHLWKHPGIPYPGLKETLEKLSRDYTLAVVSNCQNGYIDIFTTTLGVGAYFSDQECAQNTGLSKGENIRLVLARNGIEKAFYLGDTLGDMEAADAAGVPFVHAAYGFGKPNRETPAVKSLSELPALAAELLKN